MIPINTDVPRGLRASASVREEGNVGKVSLGINLEFVRHDDKPFEWGVEKATALGYEYVEPMVHWGRELLSEAGYFHSVSMLDDPYRVKRACAKAGVKLSGLSAHTPLVRPEIVNRHCLLNDRDVAVQKGIEFDNPENGVEPGPYYLLEVYRRPSAAHI